MPQNGFVPGEYRVLRSLNTPYKLQRFLDEEIAYNKDNDGISCRSPRFVLRRRKAQCMEGALFAAAVLSLQGHPPLVVDLEAVRDDDHVLAVFRRQGLWGAVAKSNYSGLRFREPIYRSIRELVMSYFEHYFNLRGEKTLRGYSRPVSLKPFERIEWRTAEGHLWEIPEYLVTLRHYPIFPPAVSKQLFPMDRRLFEAGKLGAR